MATQNMQMHTQQNPAMAGTWPSNNGWDWSGEVSTAPEWNDNRPVQEARFQSNNGQMTAPNGLQMAKRIK